MCSLSKEQSILSRETIQNRFLNCASFRLRLFILYQACHSQALTPACGALVLSDNAFKLDCLRLCHAVKM